jgi:hypothetical protein
MRDVYRDPAGSGKRNLKSDPEKANGFFSRRFFWRDLGGFLAADLRRWTQIFLKGGGSEIEEDGALETGECQVVDDLGVIGQPDRGLGFAFNNGWFETNCLVEAGRKFALGGNLQKFFPLEWDIAQSKLDSEAVLVNRIEKTPPQLPVDSMAAPMMA